MWRARNAYVFSYQKILLIVAVRFAAPTATFVGQILSRVEAVFRHCQGVYSTVW